MVAIIASVVWLATRGASPKGKLTSIAEVQRIAPADAKAMLDSGEAMLYDVRSLEAYRDQHAVGAVALPEGDLDERVRSLPGDKALILYCT